MDTKTSPLALLNDPSLLKTDALIGGEWVAGSLRFDVTDPANGAKLTDVANLGPAECHLISISLQPAPRPIKSGYLCGPLAS